MAELGATIGRRGILIGGGVTLGALAVGVVPATARSVVLPPTPMQTAGPFYPPVLPADMDGDLVRVAGQAAQALGTVTRVGGVVRDVYGQPVPGALIDIWQCDANGRYIHPGDRGGRPRDPGFQGFGRVRTDADGAYAIRTIRPVPYGSRTPHIHFAVRAPGYRTLVTQMYVQGEPRNERDFLFRSLSDGERPLLLVDLAPAPELERSSLRGRFDLVLMAG